MVLYGVSKGWGVSDGLDMGVCGTQLPLEAYNIELCEHSW